jgi:glutaredoxin
MAKRYFAERGLPYDDVDVSQDRLGLKEMVAMTGQYGVPVIVVDGHAIVGWDRDEFERLLAE